MANAVPEVVTGTDFESIPSEKRQYYYINNPSRIVMNKKDLSLDVVILDEDRPAPCAGAPLHWANPLHVLEVKPYDPAICDGKGIPRLIINGKQAGCHLCD
jgi:hypothetical protein